MENRSPKAKESNDPKQVADMSIAVAPTKAGKNKITALKRDKKSGYTASTIEFSQIYTYHDRSGVPLGYITRVEPVLPDDDKKFFPLTYRENKAGERSWYWIGFDEPAPLYRLDLLAQNPDARVLVVEGEKCADAGNKTLGPLGWVVVTWPGGSNAYKKTDFSPLKGRNCVCWPDHDKADKDGNVRPLEKRAGWQCMQYIAVQIGAQIVRIPEEYPNKWDIADAVSPNDNKGVFLDDIQGFIEKHLQNIPANDNTPLEAETLADNRYFSAEGISANEEAMYVCYYFKKEGNIIVPIRADRHNHDNLTTLAPVGLFEKLLLEEGRLPIKDNGQTDYRELVSIIKQRLISTCCKIGYFDVSKRRGRGVWLDNNRLVLHLGDRLYVDKREVEINKLESKHRYRACVSIPFSYDNIASGKDGEKLLVICTKLPWVKEPTAYLLAGWLFLARLCGALKWRSSVWIYGPRGSGKTYIIADFIRLFLGDFAIIPKGKSTAAGIRQALRGDALPTVFEEAEGALQSVLDKVPNTATVTPSPP